MKFRLFSKIARKLVGRFQSRFRHDRRVLEAHLLSVDVNQAFGKHQKLGGIESCFGQWSSFFTISSAFVRSVRCECNRCEPDTACETENIYPNCERKALRVIPRGKHRLTVYRAHQVDHLGMVLKSKICFWTSIRCSENSENFGALSRVFDNGG